MPWRALLSLARIWLTWRGEYSNLRPHSISQRRSDATWRQREDLRRGFARNEMEACVAAWDDLGQGRYLRVCPDELRDELIAAMQLCLGCGDLPLARVNRMRREYMHASLRAANAAPGDAAAQRKAGMQKLAVALSPNFKDVLRARVLSSGAPYRSFLILYRRLLTEHVLPHLAALTRESSFAVQREPSLRFALPNATALGARKFDDADLVGMHTDADYGHRPSELNLAFALTRFEGSASLFFESAPMRGDFTEVKMGEGDIFAFAGATCRHYNKRNATDDARVSFDFRVVPMSMCAPLFSQARRPR